MVVVICFQNSADIIFTKEYWNQISKSIFNNFYLKKAIDYYVNTSVRYYFHNNINAVILPIMLVFASFCSLFILLPNAYGYCIVVYFCEWRNTNINFVL